LDGPDVREARDGRRRAPGGAERGQQNPDEQGDDRDDDERLDERERARSARALRWHDLSLARRDNRIDNAAPARGAGRVIGRWRGMSDGVGAWERPARQTARDNAAGGPRVRFTVMCAST